jgi:hypothetical protein
MRGRGRPSSYDGAAALLLVLCACLVPRARAKPTELVLVSLDLEKYPEAVCNDGSPGTQQRSAARARTRALHVRALAQSAQQAPRAVARWARRAVQPGAVA